MSGRPLVMVPHEAEVVRRIFREAAAGGVVWDAFWSTFRMFQGRAEALEAAGPSE